MSIFQILKQFILEPLILLMQMIYGASYNLMGSLGAAIIPLSLAVNFMLLPFYKRADAIQEEDRAVQEKMKAGLAHIKKSFQGDERYMLQLDYYRQHHYKPIYSLRSILPLALELPFFIAAYQFLSHVEVFQGEGFAGILTDLSTPDRLLKLGGASLNLLPIAMTIINMISSEIYARGASLKERLTLHGMALVFLLLLYHSPSALVLYWTMNNIFSLVKNVIARSKRQRLARCAAYSLLGACSVVYAFAGLGLLQRGFAVFALIGLFLQIPSVRMFLLFDAKEDKDGGAVSREDTSVFRTACLFLALFMGLMIPSATIASSPAEFMVASDPCTPLLHLLPAFLLAAGTFLLWMGLFYYLSPPKIRRLFTAAAVTAAGIATVDYLFFGTNLGTLLPMLSYEIPPSFTSREMLVNYAALMAVAVLLFVLWQKKKGWARLLLISACAAALGISGYNAVRIQAEVPQAVKAFQQASSDDDRFTLTTEGKNVIVFVLDRACGGYLPYLFAERPQLKEQFDGFTWYPNALSYSNATNTAIPALYGGYDYRPDKMNARSDELLVDKHNEALKVMPAIFSEAGYAVTVCDPPYANYSWVPDLSIYDEYPQIKTFLTDSGQYRESADSDAEKQRIWKRNFFCFGLMKSAPLFMQSFLYQGGGYYDTVAASMLFQNTEGFSIARGYRDDFLDAYYALCAYPELTETTSADIDTFFMLYNSTAHNLCLLQEPEYEPAIFIDNTEFDQAHGDRFFIGGRELIANDIEQMTTYHCHMAALIKLGEWMDDLRAKGVYDNTRIIIVADHGALVRSFSDMLFGDEWQEDALGFNPLLMVKDFGESGFQQSDVFMTNADTPSLAFEGLIDDPVNPFTGALIHSDEKKEAVHHIFCTAEWMTNVNNGTTFLPDTWLSLVSDNIFDMANWSLTEEYGGGQ